MNKDIILIIILFLFGCVTKVKIPKNNEKNFCEECITYIQKLKRELKSCGYSYSEDSNIQLSIINSKDCQFDKKDFITHFSCFAGKKQKEIKNVLGISTNYFINCSDCTDGMDLLFYFSYTKDSILRDCFIPSETIKYNSIIECQDCKTFYSSVNEFKNFEDNMNSFLEKFGSCLFGKNFEFLNKKVNLFNIDTVRQVNYIKYKELRVILNGEVKRIILTYQADLPLFDIKEITD